MWTIWENRLRWFGYDMRRDDLEAVRIITKMNVNGKRGKEYWRIGKQMINVIENDIADQDFWRCRTKVIDHI